MQIRKGKGGVHLSHQDDFPLETECGCGNIARLAFTAMEGPNEEYYICDMHKNGLNGFWPHDVIAVAVYFCSKCAKPVTLFNQG